MSNEIWAIILASGTGSRISKSTLPKQFLNYKELPIFWHSALTLSKHPIIKGLIFVLPNNINEQCLKYLKENSNLEYNTQNNTQEYLLNFYKNYIKKLSKITNLNIKWEVTFGGNERQESTYNGLKALPESCSYVLVHDSARPFVSPKIIEDVIYQLTSGELAVTPAIKLTDTIKKIDYNNNSIETLDRDKLVAVQTPQGFDKTTLINAHKKAIDNNYVATDDTSLCELCHIPIKITLGELNNKKITTNEDLDMLTQPDIYTTRTSFGYDVHRYGGTRPFILGGVPIPTNILVDAHSDGDTLLHALMDALLGSISAGDIGSIFPDSDKTYENMPSSIMLSEVLELLKEKETEPLFVDITIIAQTPKISAHRQTILSNVAKMMNLPVDCVSVKATTEEKLGFTGEKKGIKVVALVTTKKKISNI